MMTHSEEKLLSMIYTHKGYPIESSDINSMEAMEYLEKRGLVNWRWIDDGAYHEAVWVTPAKPVNTLDWERETQKSR